MVPPVLCRRYHGRLWRFHYRHFTTTRSACTCPAPPTRCSRRPSRSVQYRAWHPLVSDSQVPLTELELQSEERGDSAFTRLHVFERVSGVACRIFEAEVLYEKKQTMVTTDIGICPRTKASGCSGMASAIPSRHTGASRTWTLSS